MLLNVFVKGPRLEECIRLFLDLLLSDLSDLDRVPVYFIQGLYIEDPASAQGPSPGLGAAAGSGSRFFSLADIRARPDEFEKIASRGVLSNKCIRTSVVLLLEVPISVGRAASSNNAQGEQRQLHFEVAQKVSA